MVFRRAQAKERFSEPVGSCVEGAARMCERADTVTDRPDLRLALTVGEGDAAREVVQHGFGAGALTDIAAIEAEHGEAAARDAALALAQTLARLAGYAAEFSPLRG